MLDYDVNGESSVLEQKLLGPLNVITKKKCLEHKLFELKVLEHWMLNGRQTKKRFFFAGFETIKLSLDYPTFRHTHTH